MLYLLDASVLITAHNGYYALNRVPEFWAWLLHHGQEGAIKLPADIYTEVEDGNDPLAAWMAEADSKEALRFAEEPVSHHLQEVLLCYGDDLSEDDLITIGKDPFLVAAALPGVNDRIVVTAEVSRPARTGPRRHIPNICGDCGVQWITPIQLLAALNFTTAWNS